MGQNRKVRESDYSKITIPLSKKEKLMLLYNAVAQEEIVAHEKKERRLFVYQVILVVTIVSLAFLKEKFFPSHIEWIEWIMKKL